MGSVARLLRRKGVKMKVVALLLSLSVVQGYYLYPRQQVLLSPLWGWNWRVTPLLPTSPVVINLETDFQCPGAGNYPNLEDACDSFFMCASSSEKPVRITCNPGLKFDGSIGQCNWEYEVGTNCNWDEDAIAIGKHQ